MSSLSSITISEDSPDSLDGYARIPSVVLVREVFDIVSNDAGISSLASAPRQLAAPFLKDYDVPPCLPPTSWQTRFDVNSWGFLTAWHNHMPVGKAAIAWPAHELGLLDRPSDVAILWDIRISADSHRRGLGTRLFRAVESWAARRGAHYLEAETPVSCPTATARSYFLRVILAAALLAVAFLMAVFFTAELFVAFLAGARFLGAAFFPATFFAAVFPGERFVAAAFFAAAFSRGAFVSRFCSSA